MKPEFSFFIDCNTLKEATRSYDIEADEAERRGLAKRFDLLSLDHLSAHAEVSRESGDVVRLVCHWKAEIVQACVVTANPLKNILKGIFERTFSESAEPYFGSDTEPEGEGELTEGELNDDIPDPPDPMIKGGFDLGETVAEQLSLEIDPFPRSVGASFEGYSSAGDDGPDDRINPFAVLEQLKKKS